MHISLVVFIFFTALGVLLFFYALHFRRRVLAMGPERLRAALSRTVSGEEGASESDLRQGAQELEDRLQRGFLLTSAILAVILIACLTLTAASTLPELVFALSGVCILLASAVLCIMLLRDIPRNIRKQLDKEMSRGL